MPVMLAAMTLAPITAPCSNTSLREVVVTLLPANASKNVAPAPQVHHKVTRLTNRKFQFALTILRPRDATLAIPPSQFGRVRETAVNDASFKSSKSRN